MSRQLSVAKLWRPIRLALTGAILSGVGSLAAAFAAEATDADIVLTLPKGQDPTVCFPQGAAPIVIAGHRVSSIQLPQGQLIAFSDGLAPIRVGGKWGYVDMARSVVIPARFDFAQPFRQERAMVTVGQLKGYIDKGGKFVVEPKYSSAHDFERGVAPVCFEERWGLIDRDGSWVVPASFKRISPSVGGLSAEAFSGEKGFIDARGVFIRDGKLGAYYRPAK